MYAFSPSIPTPVPQTSAFATRPCLSPSRRNLYNFYTPLSARRYRASFLLRATLAPPPPPPSLRRRASDSVHDLDGLPSLLTLLSSQADNGKNALLVVEVWSKGCRACIGMRRTYERVADAHVSLGVKFARICVDGADNDSGDALRAHLNVRAMPLFVFYKGGARIDHFASASREQLEQCISDNL